MSGDQLFAEGAAAYHADDFPLAAARLLPLARRRHAGAQYILALMYRWGRGVKPSARRSLALVRAAADQGHAKAALELSVLLDPDCVSFPVAMQKLEKDYVASRRYLDLATRRLRKLAADGDTGAMADLGFLFHYGYGVGMDGAEAIRWYTAAFDGGEWGAANALCLVYYEGDARVRDKEKALFWYMRAQELGCRCISVGEFKQPPQGPRA